MHNNIANPSSFATGLKACLAFIIEEAMAISIQFSLQNNTILTFILFIKRMTPEEEDIFYSELVSNFALDEFEENEPNVVDSNNYIQNLVNLSNLNVLQEARV